MKQELKDKWVNALESGKYEQGKGRLRRGNNTLCCLGVLCDIAGEPIDEMPYSGMQAVLTRQQLEKFGMRNEFQRGLAAANDGNSTFRDIAAILRAVPAECM